MMRGMALTETMTENGKNHCEEGGDRVHYLGTDTPLEITFKSP